MLRTLNGWDVENCEFLESFGQGMLERSNLRLASAEVRGHKCDLKAANAVGILVPVSYRAS
jgi:hypothetical protein